MLTTDLPTDLYTAAQTRELDRLAIRGVASAAPIPGIQLMKRAARAALEALRKRWPSPPQLTVYCGAGNNAGDGYLLAALAQEQGLAVRVVQLGAAQRLSGDARLAYDYAQRAGVSCQPFSECFQPEGVVVDALLGTGIRGEVKEPFRLAIQQINHSDCAVLAVDIPSGLCSDTGRVLGVAVKAQATVSFIGLKQGLLTAEGPGHCGDIYFADLGVSEVVYRQVPVLVQRLSLPHWLSMLKPRPATAHKGECGHVLVIGGDYGYGGAALMTARAAIRCGAGLCSLATRAEHLPAALLATPELMTRPVTNLHQLAPLLEKADVLALGPGLGQQPWGEQLWQGALETGKPVVLDADGLNRLARQPLPARDNWILTPHPGEAARLLGCSTAEIQQDRFAAVRALQQRFGGVVLLKGAGTLIKGKEDTVFVLSAGNAGMASGGMGDVLTGIIASLWSQGLDALQATCLGACLHGEGADLAARDFGQRGLLATDLLPYVRELINSGQTE